MGNLATTFLLSFSNGFFTYKRESSQRVVSKAEKVTFVMHAVHIQAAV